MMTHSTAFLAGLMAVLHGIGAQDSTLQAPCPTIVGELATYFVNGKPSSQLARVEVRQCSPEEGYKIQVVAWPSGRQQSPLVIDTHGGFGVTQAVASANIFVIEIGGGMADRVFVVGYENGKPKLLQQGVTTESAEVKTSAKALDLLIPEFSIGGAPPRTARYHFNLDFEGMNPPEGAEPSEEPSAEAPQPSPSTKPPGVAPVPVKMASLEYPRLAAGLRITGTVVLQVRVDKAGMASQVHAVSGPTLLVYAALDNIKLWRFLPARNAVPGAKGEFEFRYVFELKGEADNAHWSSEMTYEYPNKVTVTSKVLLLQPDGAAHAEPAHR
jgi:TonB family protein